MSKRTKGASRKTISGRIDRYSDWLERVRAEADRVGLPESVRGQVTGPMLRDAWDKHLLPDYYVARVAEYFGPDMGDQASTKA